MNKYEFLIEKLNDLKIKEEEIQEMYSLLELNQNVKNEDVIDLEHGHFEGIIKKAIGDKPTKEKFIGYMYNQIAYVKELKKEVVAYATKL